MVCGRVSRVARWCVAVVVVAVVCAGVWCGVASRRRAAGRAAVLWGLDLVVADGGRRFEFVYRGGYRWQLNRRGSSGVADVVSVRRFACGDGFRCPGFVLSAGGRRVVASLVAAYGSREVSVSRVEGWLARPSYDLDAGSARPGGMVVPGWLVDFLDWGQAPATVRDAHTGKVFKDQQYLSRWDFVRQSQDPASPYFSWGLVK